MKDECPRPFCALRSDCVQIVLCLETASDRQLLDRIQCSSPVHVFQVFFQVFFLVIYMVWTTSNPYLVQIMYVKNRP